MRARFPLVGIGIVLIVIGVIAARFVAGWMMPPSDGTDPAGQVEPKAPEQRRSGADVPADPGSDAASDGQAAPDSPDARTVNPPDRSRDPVGDAIRSAPEGPFPELAELDPLHEAFLRIDLSPDLDEDMPRAEQDELLKDMLRDKRDRMAELSAAYQALLEDSPEGPLRRHLLERMGDLNDHMGVSLLQSTPPTYLAENQLDVYEAGMKGLADRYFETADQYWAEAAR